MTDEINWQLQCHTDHPAKDVEEIAISAELSKSGKIWLRYHIDGNLNSISLPDPKDPERTDNLWHTTCCELFISVPEETAYGEYNLSPSSQWAAYQFSDFRKDAADMEIPDVPEIHLDASETHLALEAEFTLPERFTNKTLQTSFSVIVEEMDGTKSFWAVTHPPGKPEFHHRDCFSVFLEAKDAL